MLLLYWLFLCAFFLRCLSVVAWWIDFIVLTGRNAVNNNNNNNTVKNLLQTISSLLIWFTLYLQAQPKKKTFTWNWISIHVLSGVCVPNQLRIQWFTAKVCTCVFFSLSLCLPMFFVVIFGSVIVPNIKSSASINWFWFSHSLHVRHFFLSVECSVFFFIVTLLSLCQTRIIYSFDIR